MTRVRYADRCRSEALAEVRRSVAAGEHQWAVRLTEDLIELEDLVARFPDAGIEIARDGRATLRKMKLRHCPFVVWYTTDEARDEVVLARLFHARQRTPAPRLGRRP